MNRVLALLLILLSTAHTSFAQYISDRDSLMAVEGSSFVFRDGQLLVPAAFLSAATVIHCAGHQDVDAALRNAVQDKWRAGKPVLKFDNYIQYLPYAMDAGLSFAGVRAERCFVDRAIEGAIAWGTSVILVRSLKYLVHSPRPDSGAPNSFPSGHTCTAFTGAELVRMEYGCGWGAGAYALACTVGTMRIYNDRHWLSDVLAGAGIGILSAHIGGWLLEPVKNILNIRAAPDSPRLAIVPAVDPFGGAVCASLALQF